MEYETPTVHLNGTGFKSLWESYDKLDDAFYELFEQWARVDFNARDYYVNGPDSWHRAVSEREQIGSKLRDIKSYVDAIRQSLDAQNPDRK